jgi:hypothetical protein
VRRGAGLALLVALLVAGLPACSRSDRGARAAAPADAGEPVDLETMAFLSEARALHHEANVKEEAGDARGAADVVLRIVRARRPHPGRAIPEVEEVLADAWARISELDLRAGDPAAAAGAAREGLAHARAPSYFRGHLLEVEGIAEETRSAALADAGDARGAGQARASAMALLEEAVSVQDRVIEAALDGGADEGGAQ